jgi:hypothetical protein
MVFQDFHGDRKVRFRCFLREEISPFNPGGIINEMDEIKTGASSLQPIVW